MGVKMGKRNSKTKRRVLIIIMLLTMLVTNKSSMNRINAAQSSSLTAKQVMNALEIVKVEETGSYRSSSKVTRAEFAKMLVNLTNNKEKTVSAPKIALFKDVSAKHQFAGYIKIAIDSGWMTGYSDGTFKPNQTITLQEAVKAVLKILGYNNDFSLYSEKDLNSNITKTKTQKLTRGDCVNLFYNMLITTSADGKIYGESLGYSLNSNGEIDYLKIVNTNLTGPVIANKNWESSIPFETSSAIFYRDEVLCKKSEIKENDVLYYSKSQKTIWAYSKTTTGIVEKITPDKISPESVTIAGNTYSLGTEEMILTFGTGGTIQAGQAVTVFLGKDNCIAGVKVAEDNSTAVTGVVTSTQTRSNNDYTEGTFFENYLTMVDAKGNTYEYGYSGKITDYKEGDVISVSIVEHKITITKQESQTLSGKINEAGTKLGLIKIASSIAILDYKDGNYMKVYPARISGVTLRTQDILYYSLNSVGEITELMLKDVTGDLSTYGIILSVEGGSGNGISTSKCTYDINGTKNTGTTYMQASYISIGPSGFAFESKTNNMYAITNLTGKQISSKNQTKVQIGNTSYQIADNVVVYYLKDSVYHATTLEKVKDLDQYTLTAYYDDSPEFGGRIRVMVAKDPIGLN